MTTTELDTLARRLGMSAAEARKVAAGTAPTTSAAALAAPALRHAYARRAPTPADGPSTPQAFELGLRLRAADNGGLEARSSITPVIDPEPGTIAALSYDRGSYQVAVHGPTPTSHARLTPEALVDALAVPAAAQGAVLVVASLAHVEKAITDTAALVAPGHKARAVLGALLRWRHALETPGIGLAVHVLDALTERYVTNAPSAERDLRAWCRLLRVPARTEATALLGLYRQLQPSMIGLPLSRVSYDNRWGGLAEPADSPREGEWAMSNALADREAMAQWLPAERIKSDPLYAAAMQWEGRVLTGVLGKDPASRQYMVAVGHVCRLRAGSQAVVEQPQGRPVQIDVAASQYVQGTGIVLTLSAGGVARRISALDKMVGQGVRVRGRAQPLSQALGASGNAAQRRSEADKVSWLADLGRVPASRDVPWDVMFAAAI